MNSPTSLFDFHSGIKILRPPPGFPTPNYRQEQFIPQQFKPQQFVPVQIPQIPFNFKNDYLFETFPVKIFSDLNRNAPEFVPVKTQESTFFDLENSTDFLLEKDREKDHELTKENKSSFFDMDNCIDFLLEKPTTVITTKKKRSRHVFYGNHWRSTQRQKHQGNRENQAHQLR